MTSNGAAAIRQFVLARVEQPLMAKGLTPSETPHDYDLVSEGVIDSFGIIELIADLEGEYQVELDFDDVEPETLTVIGPLSDYVAQLVERRS